jgi:hypothetical protein
MFQCELIEKFHLCCECVLFIYCDLLKTKTQDPKTQDPRPKTQGTHGTHGTPRPQDPKTQDPKDPRPKTCVI